MPVTLEVIRPYADRWSRKQCRSSAVTSRFSRAQIAAGIAAGEFAPAYQPQLDLQTSRVVGFEALARWVHPDFGVIGPGDFIPQIESYSCSAELSLRLLGQALEDLSELDSVRFLGRIAINVTQTALELEGFGRACTELCSVHGVPGQRITLELTEHGAAFDSTHVEDNLTTLCGHGIMLSLDDFWVGHNSLDKEMLCHFRQIKIDTHLTHSSAEDPIAKAGVASILAFARSLGWTCVAEGIESQADHERLAAEGCGHGQGFHYSPPLFIRPAKQWLANRYP